MNLCLNHSIWLTVLGGILTLLAIHPAHAGIQIQVPDDARLEFIGEPRREDVKLEPEKAFSLDLSQPVQISSATRVPIILVPVFGKDEQVKVNSPLLKQALGSANQTEMSELLSTLMTNIADIQKLIRNKNLQEAQTQLQALQTKYPNIKFFEFIRASILLLMGNRAEAQRAASEGLKAHPDYQEGKAFLEGLKGGAP